MTSRRQHYVWRHYLEAWATDGLVSALSKTTGKIFSTNPINIAVERDFYRLADLQPNDEVFLHQFIEKSPSDPHLKSLAWGWLRIALMPALVRRVMSQTNLPTEVQERMAQQMEQYEIEAEEKYLSNVEGDSTVYLSQMRSQDSSFWREDDSAMWFSYFISLQLLRTKRMRDVYVARFADGDQASMKRTWPVLRQILATNLGWSLFAERREFELHFLTTVADRPFLTGDQPLRNMVAPTEAHDVAIYYPVSPTVAALFTHNRADHGLTAGPQSSDVIERLNRDHAAYALEHVFGDRTAVLERVQKSAS